MNQPQTPPEPLIRYSTIDELVKFCKENKIGLTSADIGIYVTVLTDLSGHASHRTSIHNYTAQIFRNKRYRIIHMFEYPVQTLPYASADTTSTETQRAREDLKLAIEKYDLAHPQTQEEQNHV